MLLTELILSKDTALSQVWIAAHYERKLSKQQALRISVEDSVQDILKENIEPTALRMSGQLMLGVVRIYSRKTQYLFDDCKDVRDKITMAFRPGQVDLPPDQLHASKSAITITQSRPGYGNEYTTDLLLNDHSTFTMSWQDIAKNFQPLGMLQHLAAAAAAGNAGGGGGDINLPSGTNRPHYAASARSSSISRESEYGSPGRRGRAGTVEPFEQGGIDLGLDLGFPEGDHPGDHPGDVSIEYGREAGRERAPSIAPSIASGLRIAGSHRASSVLSDRSSAARTDIGGSVLGAGAGEVLFAANQGRSRDVEEGGEMDEGPGDLGLDLGEGFELPELEGEQAMDVDVDVDVPARGEDVEGADAEARARARRESTGLSTPPPEEQDDLASIMADITPRTANRIAQMALTREKAAMRKSALAAAEGGADAAGQRKQRKTVRIAGEAVIDDEIEMDEALFGRGGGRGPAGRRDVSSILGKENYISGNEAQLALERIQADPAAFYNPTVQVGNQTFFMATPAGIDMADELKSVFMIPTNVLRRRPRPEAEGEGSPEARKRARLAAGQREEGVDDDDDDEAIEAGRRVQRGLSERFPAEIKDDDHPMGDITFGTEAGLDVSGEIGGFDELPMMEGMEMEGNVAAIRGRSVTPALSVAGTARERLASEAEARSIHRAGSQAPFTTLDDCPIGSFDPRHRVHGAPLTESQVSSSQAASQYAVLSGVEGEAASQADARQHGYSQNTVKAATFLRGEFSTEDGQVEEGKTISFREKAKNASKRAASSFFFELLVLGTRDCITLDQPERYGDIAVQAKPKLFEVTSRAAEAAAAAAATQAVPVAA